MTRLTNIQRILSNITSVEKVQYVQQHQAQMEQSRLASQNRKNSKRRRKKIQDARPSDEIEIRGRDDQQNQEQQTKNKEQVPVNDESDESADNILHIDIRV